MNGKFCLYISYYTSQLELLVTPKDFKFSENNCKEYKKLQGYSLFTDTIPNLLNTKQVYIFM
jgi:hypothetical protein